MVNRPHQTKQYDVAVGMRVWQRRPDPANCGWRSQLSHPGSRERVSSFWVFSWVGVLHAGQEKGEGDGELAQRRSVNLTSLFPIAHRNKRPEHLAGCALGDFATAAETHETSPGASLNYRADLEFLDQK